MRDPEPTLHTPHSTLHTQLVDTHAHLNDPQFEHDIVDVLDRAWEAGVAAIINVGYDLESSRSAFSIADQVERVFAAVGIHPNYSSDVKEEAWQETEELAELRDVVAVGEIGLDLYRDFAPVEAQRAAFVRQLELAARLDIPVIVHSRNASQECLDIISAIGLPPCGGVMHCFEGTCDQAARALEMGMYISANGMATWDNRTDIREMLKVVPLNRLLIETDSPYLAPKPIGRRRNEPAYLRHVVECLAEVFAPATADEIAAATTANAAALFGLDI